MEGIALAARYSFITNRLRYCGPDDAYKSFLRFIKDKDEVSKELIKDHITRFEGLYPYLEAIAKKSKKDIFDKEVVEAYWIGNSLLDKFRPGDMKKIVMALTRRGLPPSYGKKLCEDIPPMLPHHSFNVIYVGVGKVTGSVEYNIDNINNCLIRPAEVLEVGEKIKVRHRPYKFEQGKLVLSAPMDEYYDYEPMFTQLEVEDIVSIHWKFIVDKLDDDALKNLLKYTFKNVLALNGHQQKEI
jgi:hypothetical protein